MRQQDNVAPFPLLERIRGIAQEGLAYADNPFDRERYEELLLAANATADRLHLDRSETLALFRQDLGVVTPKVGVEAAIRSADGRLLLIRRSDDDCYGLPGGWARLGETADAAVCREVLEETGLVVRVDGIIRVFSRLPGEFQRPHTSYFLLYACSVQSGQLTQSRESTALGYFQPDEISNWHKDHHEHALAALAYFQVASSAD